MLSFSQYLIERAFSADVSSDDKGKLHELLLAKHFGSHLDPSGEGYVPLHFRADKDNPNPKIAGKSPQQVHDEIRKRIGEAAYNEIDNHAKQTAEATIQHLIRSGRIRDRNDIRNVHWTSNRDTANKAGDHEKLTNVKDTNATGDLILTTNHPTDPSKNDYVPISAKHGGQAKPNFKNDGLESLEQKSGLEPGTLTNMQNEMQTELERTYGKIHPGRTQNQKHTAFKRGLSALENEQEYHQSLVNKALQDHLAAGGKKSQFVPPKFEPESEEAKAAVGARAIGVKHRARMAKTMADSFNRMASQQGSDEPLRRFIVGQVSPENQFRHVVAHSHVQNDGSAVSVIHDMDKIAPDHISQFENIRASHGAADGDSEGGVSVNFYGDHIPTGRKNVLVATQTLKGGSGPYKGSNGVFNLNPISQRGSANKIVASHDSPKNVSVSAETPDSATINTEPKPRVVNRFSQTPAGAVRKTKVMTSTPAPAPAEQAEDEDRFSSEGGGSAIGSRPVKEFHPTDGSHGGYKF